MFCLFLDGSITGPSGGRGLISVGRGESTSRMTVLFTITEKKHSCTKSRENKVKI